MRYNFNSFSFIQQNENMEQQNKQQEEGTFVPERAVDALTKALGSLTIMGMSKRSVVMLGTKRHLDH